MRNLNRMSSNRRRLLARIERKAEIRERNARREATMDAGREAKRKRDNSEE